MIEWWGTAFAGLLAIITLIYIRVQGVPVTQEAGNNTMGIKNLLSIPTETKPEAPAQSFSDRLANAADEARKTQEVETKNVEVYAEMSTQAQAKADAAAQQVIAIEQAKSILDQAGVTL